MSGRTAELWVLVCTQRLELHFTAQTLQMAQLAPDNSMSFSGFTFVRAWKWDTSSMFIYASGYILHDTHVN